MSEYIPDQIEMAEESAERWYFDHAECNGKMRCYQCDAIFDEKDGATLSPHPCAPLACTKCVQELMDDIAALQNPDRLTPEQVETSYGFRLLDEDEIVVNDWLTNEIQQWRGGWLPYRRLGSNKSYTYRTRLSRAELRKARGLEP